MRKLLTSAVFIAGAVAAGGFFAGHAAAQEKLVIAVVPKNLNNPFFDQAKLGCEKAVAEIGADKVECLFTGPPEHGGGDEQVQIVADLIAKGVDGIAVAAANAAAMASVMPAAKEAGIPVLTWDTDLLPEAKEFRVAYIGTHNYDIGVEPREARAEDQAARRDDLHPVGRRRRGQPQRAHAGHPRHARRRRARRSAGRAARGRERLDRGRRLPALHQRRLPALRAAAGGHARASIRIWMPSSRPAASRSSCLTPTGTPCRQYKDKIASGELALVVADTLPVQIDLMKEGLSAGQVGQRPFEMGYKVIYAIKDMKEGKPAPADPTYTGLDVCTPDNVDTCIGG